MHILSPLSILTFFLSLSLFSTLSYAAPLPNLTSPTSIHSPLALRALSPLLNRIRYGTVVTPDTPLRLPRGRRRSAMQELEARTDVYQRATFDPKEGVVVAARGVPEVYRGQLWERSLKRDLLL